MFKVARSWIQATSIVVLLVGFLPLPVLAADASLGFAVSPPIVEISAQSGQLASGSVKIINLTDLPIDLGIDKLNFVARGEEGEVDLVGEDTLYSLAPWFKVASDLTVPARATRDVQFNIDVPANAEPGGRYGSLVFHPKQVKLPSGQSGAAVKQELAALIFLKIAGTAKDQIGIESFKSTHRFYEKGPINFELRVKGQGNVHTKPTGTITIKNMLGMKVTSVDIDSKNVLPGAIRKMTASWQDKFLIGSYTAELTLHNGNQQVLTAKASFLAIPYRFLAVVLFIFFILYWLFWRRRKRFMKAFRVLFKD